jgi:pilus assembly protein CpaC
MSKARHLGLPLQAGALLLACLLARPVASPAAEAETVASLTTEAEAFLADTAVSEVVPPKDASEELSLAIGAVENLRAEGVQRVLVAEPEILDVSVLSTNEILLKGLAAGRTDLLIWDVTGQRTFAVIVTDETSANTEASLRDVIAQLGLTQVLIQREGNKLFLMGAVESNDDLARLEELLSGYRGVTNLVAMHPPLVPPVPLPPEEPPPPLIALAVQLIELTRSTTDQLGVDWNDSITLGEQPFVDGSTTTSTTASLNDFGSSMVKRMGEPFRIGRLFRTGFSQTLNMLITDNKARVLAEPKLVTASGKPAESFIGSEIPIITASSTSVTGAVSTTIEFKRFGVSLEITPVLLADNESIHTIMETKVQDLDTTNAIVITGVTVPGFRVRETTTEVVTASGETIVIAGLLQSADRNVTSEVPGMGKMPVFGRFFRSPNITSNETELIITITPELLLDQASHAERKLMVEQALASAEVAASVEDPRLRYALVVQDRLAKAIRYPLREKELQMQGMVKLRMHLFADGTLGRVMVVESSGISSLDQEALKAAESQSPYPSFPSQLMEREIWLELPVIFRTS